LIRYPRRLISWERSTLRLRAGLKKKLSDFSQL
jgi:hypothetical protein